MVRRFMRDFSFSTLVVVGLLISFSASAAQQMQPANSGGILRGTVRDASGRLVAGAQVILAGESVPDKREATADSAGKFNFDNLPSGTFTLTANSGQLRSATVSVVVSSPGERPQVNLTLRSFDAQATAKPHEETGQPMQFADNPDFAIAAVTDWTAAGGHGSDASLRTSEAITRDAVKLSAGAGHAGGKKTDAEDNEKGSESALLAALQKVPRDFKANYSLGRYYLDAGRYSEAVHFLSAAFDADPANNENEYFLAEALNDSGKATLARDHVQKLLARRETADLHRMAGEIDENLNDPLAAVHEFQFAASKAPTEVNIFEWGSELLVHRAIWQAKEVFDEGTRLFPQSTRMLTARGATLFAGARYDEAALDLCKASDLKPDSVEPYLIMGKIEIAAPNPLPCAIEKLARFQRLQPTNSLANYFYAMALRKQHISSTDPRISEQVNNLLTQAVTLDSKCADGYLELGNLSATKKQWPRAIDFYLKAIEANPDLSDAHYRLGVAYQRNGEQAKAKVQFQLHDQIASKQAAEIQRQRESVKQFLVVLPDQTGKQEVK